MNDYIDHKTFIKDFEIILKNEGIDREELKEFNTIRDTRLSLLVSQKYSSLSPKTNKRGELDAFNRELKSHINRYYKEIRKN